MVASPDSSAGAGRTPDRREKNLMVAPTPNNAVGLETRRGLRRLVASGVLDEPTAALLDRALQKSRPKSASGWVLLLAEALGSSRDRALRAAVFSEWFYAAVDVTDDVEDGEAEEYLGVSSAIQVQLCTHLVALALHAASELGDQDLLQRVCLLFSHMACGQRLELAREDWSVAAYERMAWLTGSCQFEAYLRASAWAAECDSTPLVALAKPLGLLIHVAADEQSRDSRLLGLDRAEIERLRTIALEELERAERRLSDSVCNALVPLLSMARWRRG